jgi:hypothetical protein
MLPVEMKYKLRSLDKFCLEPPRGGEGDRR